MVDETERPLKERLASRKLIVATVLQIIWIYMFKDSALTEAGLITLTQLTVGSYFIGNVGDKFAKK